MKAFRPSWRLLGAMAAMGGLMGWIFAASAFADALDDTTLPPETAAATTPCDQFPQVTCTGENPALVAQALQIAVDTRDSLTPVLRLGPAWRFPVHIILAPAVQSPLSDTAGEAVKVTADGTTLRLEARVPVNAPDAQEFVRRQFVTALLWEKFFKAGMTFTPATRLDVVPLWLVEGLRETLADDPGHDREEIVKRAALAQRAPTLAVVTGWKDLSRDRLLNLWQRSFCYYLMRCLTQPQDRLADFQGWLESITGPNPRTAQYLFPTEMGWQRELQKASSRDRALVYTWDESAAELAGAETIALPKGKHPDDTRLCTIDTVSSFPHDKVMVRAITAKYLELTALELRAHPSWHPTLELYRQGLTALVEDPDPKRAESYLNQARALRAAEMTRHQNLLDYVNWFEVTQYMPVEASHFRNYFRTAWELDKIEADPSHPNSLREDLLKVEARF